MPLPFCGSDGVSFRYRVIGSKVYRLVIAFYICYIGCLNGGGQIRPDENESTKDVLAKVEAAYNAST